MLQSQDVPSSTTILKALFVCLVDLSHLVIGAHSSAFAMAQPTEEHVSVNKSTHSILVLHSQCLHPNLVFTFFSLRAVLHLILSAVNNSTIDVLIHGSGSVVLSSYRYLQDTAYTITKFSLDCNFLYLAAWHVKSGGMHIFLHSQLKK